MTTTVPDAYLGVWRRTLLRTPDREDTSSLVYWLQTPRWHADIRLPADRTRVTARSLGEAEAPELRVLALQQGFAGVTTVEGDLCRWHRRVDFQPPSRFADVGRVVFENPDRILEFGVEQTYYERWDRLPGSTGPWLALERAEATGTTWLFRSGEYAMRVVPRETSLPPADDLLTALSPWDDAKARRWLDFEISFSRRAGPGTWRIDHSTLPWREGEALAEGELLEAAASGDVLLAERHWRSLD